MIESLYQVASLVYPGLEWLRPKTALVSLTNSLDACSLNYKDGTSVTFGYNSTSELVEFHTEVAQQTYLAMGYGINMINVDMVGWVANFN